MAYTQGTSNQLTVKRWDSLLHEAVEQKLAFKGMIGKDKGGEGSLDSETSNYPIVEKTQLGKESGDRITLGLVHGSKSTTPWNDGKAANETMSGSEDSLVFSNLAVHVAHWRKGVAVTGKNTLQRSPYDLLSVAKDRVSTRIAQYLDDSIFFTAYAGRSPNVFRELGSTAAAPSAHPNIIYGADKSALTGMDATDIVNFALIERLRVAWEEHDLNPIVLDGAETLLFAIHPRGGFTLRADSAWKDAQIGGGVRGDANKMFGRTIGAAAGIFVKEYRQIDTAKAYSALTTNSAAGTAGSIDAISAATVGFGAATDYRMNLLIGANAFARARALNEYMERDKNDDYKNKFGFAGGLIWGDRRADFAAAADTGTDGTVNNQSSILVYSYSPNVNSNFTGPAFATS
jgi:N4-gp56 family major capsid protein